MSDRTALFRAKAPGIMALLMADFALTDEEAAAILGNIGGETGGFHSLQEKNPLVRGSRGGWGWAQWTGPRRRAFEAYCARNDLDPASDKANYSWMFVELKGPERRAIPALKRAVGLRNKVVAFERAYERAGIPHHAGRVRWAEIALAEWRKAPKAAPSPDVAPQPNPIPVPAPTPAPAPTPQPEPKKESSMKGKRTITFGSILVTAGAVLSTLTPEQIAALVPPQYVPAAVTIIGGLVVLLRAVTDAPISRKAA